MPVKLSEVARHAGVSLATASRVLNGSARTPAADIAERVQAAALELGYVANAQAQALARSATGLFGLVVHDIADPYFSAIAHGVQQVALTSRRQVLLASTDIGEDAELTAVNAFISYRTDAIILAASRRETEDPRLSKALAQYIANGGRVVALGGTSIPGARSVHVDNVAGSRELVEVLAHQGVNRFAILAGPPERNTARSRVSGFLQALNDLGQSPAVLIHGSFDSQGGYQATLECLDSLGIKGDSSPGSLRDDDSGSDSGNDSGSDSGNVGAQPLCILAANDVMALGAMTALRSRGLRVPEDVQVAGFDDIPTLRDHSPGLTTYRLPLERIGELAAELALSPDANATAHVTGQVILRESAGAPLAQLRRSPVANRSPDSTTGPKGA
ncbi:LacI family DNA-binding transcriptional regulator [Arthrobacter sp. AQ5-05]|uniref:LacI family DNA-binding transcriptional regulator n=1 Tax=Arthrobacter sp. AQ5-05 TaxID=2184581 RepID=UPI0012B5235F|nr:LacI family DNA-binding transcriptional regulator [Arthrobacter sp. AQ5-05]